MVKANLRKDQLRLLWRAGITSIQPGIESFSTSVLALMNKGVSAIQNIQLLKWCKELGIWPGWNLIWGFPGEAEEEYARLAELLPALFHLPPPGGAGRIRLDRFSPHFDRAQEFGLVGVRPFSAYEHVYGLTDEARRNLAYYFAFDYADGRQVETYTAGVAQAVDAWKVAYPDADLLVIDKGSELLLWDLRPLATTPLIVLGGLKRLLYLACDAASGIDRMRSALADGGRRASAAEVEDELQPLLDRRLMIREQQRYLSLGLNLEQYRPSGRVVERLRRTIHAIGQRDDDKITLRLDDWRI